MKILNVRLGFSRRSQIAKGKAFPVLAQEYAMDAEQESDGRWIAEIVNLPGVMAYGNTTDEAMANAEAIALRVIEGSNRKK